MDKKEVTLLAILAILSALILSSIYFGFGIENLSEFKKQIQQQWQREQQEQQEINESESAEEQQEQEQNQTEEGNEEINETEQSPIILPWCNTTKTESVTSDIFGEGRGTRIAIGIERVVLGVNLTNATIACEACHTTLTYSETERTIDEWTSEDEVCSRLVSSKTYLFTNQTGNDTIELIFSNRSFVKEKWLDSEGRRCEVTNKLLREIRGANCY